MKGCSASPNAGLLCPIRPITYIVAFRLNDMPHRRSNERQSLLIKIFVDFVGYDHLFRMTFR